jgi:hypothetical protein
MDNRDDKRIDMGYAETSANVLCETKRLAENESSERLCSQMKRPLRHYDVPLCPNEWDCLETMSLSPRCFLDGFLLPAHLQA